MRRFNAADRVAICCFVVPALLQRAVADGGWQVRWLRRGVISTACVCVATACVCVAVACVSAAAACVCVAAACVCVPAASVCVAAA